MGLFLPFDFQIRFSFQGLLSRIDWLMPIFIFIFAISIIGQADFDVLLMISSSCGRCRNISMYFVICRRRLNIVGPGPIDGLIFLSDDFTLMMADFMPPAAASIVFRFLRLRFADFSMPRARLFSFFTFSSLRYLPVISSISMSFFFADGHFFEASFDFMMWMWNISFSIIYFTADVDARCAAFFSIIYFFRWLFLLDFRLITSFLRCWWCFVEDWQNIAYFRRRISPR